MNHLFTANHNSLAVNPEKFEIETLNILTSRNQSFSGYVDCVKYSIFLERFKSFHTTIRSFEAY